MRMLKHLRSRAFWVLISLGYAFWAIDFFFISQPEEFLPDFIVFSLGTIVSSFIMDAFFRKYMPNSKSWLNNKID